MHGYPARSVFKLEECDLKFGIFKPNYSVLDLGSCPGSWSMYAAQKVGPEGKVTAVDLNARMDAKVLRDFPNISFVQCDVNNFQAVPEQQYNVVMSDMAPNTTGLPTDVENSLLLCEQTLQVALKCLVSKRNKVANTANKDTRGVVVMKIFQGEGFKPFLDRIKNISRFKRVKVLQPVAVRKGSREHFIVASTA